MATSDYKYTKISDLKEGDRDVNIYGIVKYYREPIRTSTGQYNSMLTLVDESVQDDLEKGIRCNLFGNSVDELPQINKIGDIVRIHRAFIKFFNGRLQLQANKRACAWIVVSMDDVENVKSSHENFTFTIIDRRTVEALCEFYKTNVTSVDEDATNLTMFKDFTMNSYVNCMAKVIGIYRFETNYCLLKVSDGSKVNFSSFRQSGKIDNTCLMHWVDQDAAEATRNHSFDISVFDDHVKILDDLKVGDYVLFCNLHIKRVTYSTYTSGMIHTFNLKEVQDSKGWAEVILHSGRSYGRGISIVEADRAGVADIKGRVQALMDNYQANKAREHVPRPLQDSLTTTDYPAQPFRAIQTIQNTAVPNKFRLRGKLIGIKPGSIEDFVMKMCNGCDTIYSRSTSNKCCPSCPDKELEHKIYFQLLVEDHTGLLKADVYDKEAEYFLNSMTPHILLTDSARRENVELKMKTLLDDSINPRVKMNLKHFPWIELCLYSFKDAFNGTVYRVFGTSLI
ncbi:protection of telomeres protein 1-like [Clytia hemisphaerica]|uniref:Protection of telomeres protein 1 n=1 Tax=Clytia hemisphaerica TaxID=252671 RepID=A0A7M5WN09_9CNID